VLSTLTWNDVLFTSLQSNNIKRLNLELYFRLKNAAARQAYRFLDKRFYSSPSLEFELRNFACEHVGFSRSYDAAQLKRRLQPAIEELEEIGFLAPVPSDERYRKRSRGELIISLEKARPEKQQQASKANPAATEKLVSRGLTAHRAAELVRDFPAERIDEKIALHDWLVGRKDRRAAINPAGFLAEAIRNDYPLPKDYSRAMANIVPNSRRASRPCATEAPEISPADSEFERYWSGLNDAERSESESAAVASANPFHVATYNRLQAAGGPLFESVRREILATHFRARGLLPSVAEAGEQRSGE